ncbi:type II secretion system protein [Candidatus Saccharibacteria bacterium]|nr:type II secretion system protein [Candidatus Saccharibacteria bacterium]
MSKTGKYKKGFTIIEVVLVLAVAGLIFLMVFVALPALQRNQRDTQRRQDYGDLSSAISGYMASNGKLPSKSTTLAANKYINEKGEDPNKNEYVITVCEATGSSNAKCGKSDTDVNFAVKEGDPKVTGETGKGNQVYVVTRADCSGTNANSSAAPKYVNSGRAFAIYGYMESTGTYCQASS